MSNPRFEDISGMTMSGFSLIHNVSVLEKLPSKMTPMTYDSYVIQLQLGNLITGNK